MRMKMFAAESLEAAKAMIFAEMGDDAIILSEREVPGGVEVRAATDKLGGGMVPSEPRFAARLNRNGAPGSTATSTRTARGWPMARSGWSTNWTRDRRSPPPRWRRRTKSTPSLRRAMAMSRRSRRAGTRRRRWRGPASAPPRRGTWRGGCWRGWRRTSRRCRWTGLRRHCAIRRGRYRTLRRWRRASGCRRGW